MGDLPLKRALLCAALIALAPLAARAQTADELLNAGKTTDGVLTYGQGYDLNRYSTLDQVNTKTVKKLVPKWSYSLADDQGQESQPIVYKGVMYLTTHKATMAIDTRTGRQLWKTGIDYPSEVQRIACCGITNRGVALYEGKVFRTTLDAHVVAYDAATGKELWNEEAIPYHDGYTMTVAPIVADGVLILGVSGGEYGTRGFIEGRDPNTGKQVWRRYTTAAPDEPGGDTWPGDTHKRGGAPAWLTGSYDPELGLVYWGTGNGGPWNAALRKGDNLYICSMLALKPKTGELVWHYQFTPNDPFDYDGVNEPVLTTLKVDGKDRKVLMQANRNGFFYVLDRTNGEFIRGNQFIDHQNWADGLEPKTGRPIRSALTKKVLETGEEAEIWPSALGGKNWAPMAYSPKTGLAYVNSQNFGMMYKLAEADWRRGVMWVEADASPVLPKDVNTTGIFRAIDPLTGKSKWKINQGAPHNGGVLATAGDLVFTGLQTGEFQAFDARDGKKLWSYQTGSGVEAPPVTWSQDGKQMIAVVSGFGAVMTLWVPHPDLANVPKGGSVTVFALE